MKEAILEAALELYSSKPPQNISVKEVAARAGVSAALVFHYFGSKDRLERETVLYFMREHASEFVSLEEFVERNLRLIRERPGIFRFLQYVFEKEKYSGESGLASKVYEDGLRALEPLLREAGVREPRKAATLLMALIDGLALYSFFLGLEIEDYRDIIMESIRCWR